MPVFFLTASSVLITALCSYGDTYTVIFSLKSYPNKTLLAASVAEDAKTTSFTSSAPKKSAIFALVPFITPVAFLASS